MSTIKSIEDRLNERADVEFNRIREEMVRALRYPTVSFGTGTGRHWKDKDGGSHEFFILAKKCAEYLEVYRDDFRDRFRAEFVAKVDAMQKQMESYIGELQIEQGEGQE